MKFELKNESSIYESVIDRLWKTAGANIMTKMLKELKNGNVLDFRGVKIYDHGINLYKSNWFSVDEKIFNWSDVEIYSSNGEFVIKSRYEKKFSTTMSYKDVYNVHFLEQLIRIYFKEPKAKKLSDLLEK